MRPTFSDCALHLCALPLFVMATAQADASQSLPTLETLAAAWSGTRSPQCVTEHVDPVVPIVSELCVWRHSSESWAPYEVGGHRRPGHALEELTWTKGVADSAAALALRDSLSRAFTTYPLRAFACPDDARFWQAAGLYVHFGIGGRQLNGRVNVVVSATTFAVPVITQLICPGTPIIPTRKEMVPRNKLGAQRAGPSEIEQHGNVRRWPVRTRREPDGPSGERSTQRYLRALPC